MTTTYTIPTTAADLWGTSAAGINDTDTKLFVGWNGGSKVKVWIPFVVNLPKAVTVTAATLLLVGETTRTDTLSLKWGCEAVDNASSPADWTALNAKPLTTAVVTGDIATNVVAGTEYQIDVTAAVQEVLNRAGWAFGNTLAVMIHDDGSAGGDFHRFASFEHATFVEPKLQISIPAFISTGSWI